jgi:FKBP-type peptidyl-prolyl cis-trans isomerase (trigger factor)
MDEDALRNLVEEQKPRIRTQAETRAQRLVMMRLLTLHLKISVTEEELLEQIRYEAAKLNRRPEDLRKEIIESGNISAVGDRVRELKVFDQVAGMATSL